jgi:hypothetical protein
MKENDMWRSLLIVSMCLAAEAHAENLLPNPGAEAAGAGKPAGWGMYLGAGTATLATTTQEKHSGNDSICLELTGWYEPKDGKDAAKKRSVSAAIVLAENDGYGARGALPCRAGTTFVFSFWYKGDVSSATVTASGWPSADGKDTQRISIPIVAEALRPGAEWRQCTGSLRIPDSVTRFAVMIQTGGRESAGFKLGRLYVDDAQLAARSFPGGQLRGIWCALPKAASAEAGKLEVAAQLDKIKAAGLNTAFVWTESLYAAALSRPELRKADARAEWDGLGEMIRAARERQMDVHIWFSPWIYKDTARGIELREHPEWAAVNADGVADKDGVCLARPEVRRFELELLASLADRYPELAGIHIEEPGYNWGQYCYCEHCKKLCREWYGLDAADPAARPLLEHLAASSCTDFFIRLRQMLRSKRPTAWLSANGSGGSGAENDRRIGRDWVTWARLGYIDFYVPQLYTESVEAFRDGAMKTRPALGTCDMVTGLAVSWSGIYPRRQNPATVAAEIRAASEVGAKGFCVYHFDHFKDEHFAAIREAAAASKPAE